MLGNMKKKIIIIALFAILILGLSSKVIYAAEITENSDKITQTTTENVAEESKTIDEGFYIIKSALDTNKVLDIDNVSKDNEANIQLWMNNKGTNQIFELIYDKNTKTYKIKSALSGKIFDLYRAGKQNGTNVELYNDSNSQWQKWEISKTTDGYYTIKSLYSGLYLDVTANKTTNGTNIEVFTGNGGKNQKFLFEKVTIPKNNIKIDNGFYQIKSASNLNKVIDVFEASKADKAVVRNVFK